MSEEKPIEEKVLKKSKAPTRRGSRSLFAPIVLIAAGVFFLLDNLGVIAGLDWQAALRFWPLLLILLGLNLLVVQMRPPLGTILSGLVALATVAVFGYLLLSRSPEGALRSLGLPGPRDVQAESFNLTSGEARTAAITLHLSNYPSEITAGDGDDLIAGTIWSTTGLDLRPVSDADGRYEVEVGERSGGFSFNPANWITGEHTWTFTLSPDLPIDLTIDGGNGAAGFDLTGLMLSDLNLDAANGAMTATLPDGDYDIELDAGNGAITLTLPDSGRREARIDGGNGAITLLLPENVAARVEHDGGVRVDSRLERISGDDDEGVYETADYASAADRVLFIVDGGNGRVTVSAP